MFLQGDVGTGKTHIVKVILSELRRLGRRCLVSAITGIVTIQYPRGQIVHSLFCLGINEWQNALFISYISRGTTLAAYILSAGFITIDEISMLTP
jgi:hypothetical protein